MLELNSVTKRRRRPDGQMVNILDDVQLMVEDAEVLALIGPSGTGKSTFLRLVSRLEDVDAGSIRFHGQPIESLDPLHLRRQAGLVGQKPFMFPGTVRDNLLVAIADRGEPLPSDEKLQAVLDICEVDKSWHDQPARKLSVGQQQRVSLARVLLNSPRLLLLDEPTSSLDPDTAESVLGRLVDWARANAAGLLMVTHDHQLARRHAGRILILRDGKISPDTGGGRAED